MWCSKCQKIPAAPEAWFYPPKLIKVKNDIVIQLGSEVKTQSDRSKNLINDMD